MEMPVVGLTKRMGVRDRKAARAFSFFRKRHRSRAQKRERERGREGTIARILTEASVTTIAWVWQKRKCVYSNHCVNRSRSEVTRRRSRVCNAIAFVNFDRLHFDRRKYLTLDVKQVRYLGNARLSHRTKPSKEGSARRERWISWSFEISKAHQFATHSSPAKALPKTVAHNLTTLHVYIAFMCYVLSVSVTSDHITFFESARYY